MGRKLFSAIREIDENGEIKSIARRMFVTNTFDSLLAALGVSTGGYKGDADPLGLALSIIGASIAMGFFSAMLGVYLSERAERLRELEHLREQLLSEIPKESIHYRAAKLIPVYVALWSGFGAIILPILVAIPFIIAHVGIIGIYTAYLVSTGIALIAMSFLGVYVASGSGDSILLSVARFTGAGVAAIITIHILKIFLGIV
ncbi:MAG: hypothetical protein F7C32_00665 [Desulfurococcales archaeon]|nr:hypothetical protein [Desulfurococcales archaeon]